MLLSKFFMAGALVLGISQLSLAEQPPSRREVETPMRAVAAAMRGRAFLPRNVPDGFTSVELHRRPRMSENFKKYLAQLEAEKAQEWSDYVLSEDEKSGEYSKEKRAEVAKQATVDLGVRFLVEIQDVYQILKEGNPVGWVYRATDHVDAAKIRDGSGIELYLDLEMNVIATGKWQS